MLLLLGWGGEAHAATKPPKDAPYCARPGARQLFLAPMGAPFRAPAGQPYPSAQWFAAADANRDGFIDRAEVVADARAFFARLDLDHDGRLTPDEVAAYEREVAPEISLYAGARDPERRRAVRSGDGGSLGEQLGLVGGRGESSDYGGPLGAGRFAWLNIPQPVASADTDIDRVVSADEFAAAAARRFDALDTRHAGRLALADFGRTPQQVSIEGPCRPPPKPRRNEHHGPFDDPPPGVADAEAPR